MNKEINFRGHTATVIIEDVKEHIQKHWLVGSFYEANGKGMLRYIFDNEPKGGKYIDIGASIGNHSVFFYSVMNGEVISFEPSKESYSHLSENMNQNIDINTFDFELINVALGDKELKGIMQNVGENNVGMKQFVESEDGSVHVEFLDNYLNDVDGYDVIKIDVENYTSEVLLGAERVLTNGKGNVYIEAGTIKEREDADKIMSSYNYERVKGLVFNNTATYLYKKA